MQKKGAIEFSMTTIMVVIIGVAVLALGLTWIRGTFKQVGELTESSLENAETILGEVAFTGKISAPATINLDKGGDAKKFRVLVKNTGEELETFTMSYIDVGCVETTGTGSKVDVKPNEVGELTGGLIVNNCPASNEVLQINIDGSVSDDYATEAIAIQIR